MGITKWGERPGGAVSHAEVGVPDGMSLRTTFVAQGSDDRLEVEQYAKDNIPPFTANAYGGFYYIETIDCERIGHKLYHAHAGYGPRDKTLGTYRVSGSTTGGTLKIFAALAMIAKYPNDATIPGSEAKPWLLINCKENGLHPEGMEIAIPKLALNIAITHPVGVVNNAYARLLAALTGSVNSTPWLGFEAGEVLYLGSDWDYGTGQPVEVVHHVEVQRNLVDVQFAGKTITKDGWDVASVLLKDDVDVSQPLVSVKGIHIQRVYYRYPFATYLGFG